MAKLFTYGPDNVDELLSTTTSFWMQNKLEDQVFNATPFLAKMNKNKMTADGGASILVPLLSGENSTATWYSGYDIIDTTPQSGMTTAQAQWKNLATSISISGEEERQNSGKEKMISLLEGKTMQAELTLEKQLTSALFASSTLSKRITTLVEMIDATSTVQDINSTANSFWQADANNGGSFAAQGLSDMRTLWTDISTRTPNTLVDTIVTTTTVYNSYEKSLQPQVRYSSMGSAEGSFESLRFKSADVFYDSQATNGVMYMFPSANLKLVVNSNANMKKTMFVKPSNQDARIAQIIVMLQLVTNARRKLGKITSITA